MFLNITSLFEASYFFRWFLGGTLHLEGTSGYVLIAVLDDNYVIALLSWTVRNIVIVTPLVTDVNALTGSAGPVDGNEKEVVS